MDLGVGSFTVSDNPSLTAVAVHPNGLSQLQFLKISGNVAVRKLGVLLKQFATLRDLTITGNGLTDVYEFGAIAFNPLSPSCRFNISEPNLICPSYQFYEKTGIRLSSFSCKDDTLIARLHPPHGPVSGGLWLTMPSVAASKQKTSKPGSAMTSV